MTGLVFDIETRANPLVSQWLQTDAKIARLDGMTLGELSDVAMIEGFKLGQRNKIESVTAKIVEEYRKQRDDAALKIYGLEICSIACRELSGALEDIDAILKNEPMPSEFQGHVWTLEEGQQERTLIRAFMQHLESYADFPILMGFNIRGMKSGRFGFDIPVLRARCAVNAYRWPHQLPKNLGEDRYSAQLFDCCDVLYEGGCDTWLRAFGLPGKTAAGSKVAKMTPEEIRDYNANDVDVERLLCGAVINSTQDVRLLDLL